MWRRLVHSHLKTVVTSTASTSRRSAPASSWSIADRCLTSPPTSAASLFAHRRLLSDSAVKKVEDVMPIATGHEREELEAELQGREILDINFPVGPFGTKETPAVVKSYYDKRVVGCPGGEGEDEHDVVWFWLEKDNPHECPVCSQYFVLEVVGPGGPPDDDHHH